MISVPLQARCVVRIPPTDFRSGIDGLVRLVRVLFQEDPFTGTVFVFSNRSRTAIKLLYYDGQGWWLALKRLSQGKLQWWPKMEDPSLETSPISARELQVLIWNGSPKDSQFSPDWRKIEQKPPSQEPLI